MPEKKTLERARRDKREGKAATTQAGEFVREEMEHAKRGKHAVRSRKQAIAIGLSKARRSGVKVPKRGAAKRTSAAKSTGGGRKKPAAGRRASGKRASKKRS
jgi:hypothetical protein